MGNAYEPNYDYINEIYIKEIVFETDINVSDVTIFGYCFNPFADDNLLRVDYCCDFSVLLDLLLFAEESGEPVIQLIQEKLLEKSSVNPIVIDVENLFGNALKIEEIILKIYKPQEENGNGKWEEVEESLYIIEEVCAKEIFENKNIELEKVLSEYLSLLSMSYKLYLNFIQLGLSEKSARKKSGLKDEVLFRIASIQNQISKNK